MANHRYRQFIAVTMDVFAFSVIAKQSMTGFKTKLFGDSNSVHTRILPHKNKVLIETDLISKRKPLRQLNAKTKKAAEATLVLWVFLKTL
jgi:hypothetical protein